MRIGNNSTARTAFTLMATSKHRNILGVKERHLLVSAYDALCLFAERSPYTMTGRQLPGGIAFRALPVAPWKGMRKPSGSLLSWHGAAPCTGQMCSGFINANVIGSTAAQDARLLQYSQQRPYELQ